MFLYWAVQNDLNKFLTMDNYFIKYVFSDIMRLQGRRWLLAALSNRHYNLCNQTKTYHKVEIKTNKLRCHRFYRRNKNPQTIQDKNRIAARSAKNIILLQSHFSWYFWSGWAIYAIIESKIKIIDTLIVWYRKVFLT